MKRKHSTFTLLADIINRLSCDISKAINYINYEMLDHELNRYGKASASLFYFKYYLSPIKQNQ
ncbi:hypothetical protein J437_LFUL008696 [Ladona fulva]|uniref:Uncharacterized protein n=1 Tax=Ladona fulva TaxID=123851 RepID=A0A8K0KHT3_LADFU|nr:hypothetical protein J437_LFUL008696 [Ladona fulva]